MRYGLGFVLTVNASNFRQGFRRAGMEVQRFESKHSRSFQRMQRRQNALAKTTTQLVGALSGLYVGVAAFQALTEQAKKYDFEIRGLAAVTKKTRTEMDRMVHSLYKSSAGLKQFSLVEVARASRQLSQAGYAMTSGGQGAKVLEQSLNAVIASFGNLKPDQAINLGINLEKGFGRGKRGISELYDTVGEAVNLFPMQMDQIQIALGYATASAQNYNQSLESTILALGTLMPIVATASKAGVAYRNTLAGLTKPFTVDFITKHGIALRDATGGYRDAMEIMFDINEALDKTRRKDLQTRGGETQSLLHRMFGIRGKALFTAIQQLPNLVSQMPGMSHVTKDTDPREAYRALQLKHAEGAPGALGRLAGAMSSSAEIIDRRFNATLENAAQTMGMAFLPMVNDAKVAIGDFVESISKSGGLLSVVSKLGSAFAAFIPALAVLTASLGVRAVGNLTLSAFSTFRAGGPTLSSATPLSTMQKSGGWVHRVGSLLGLGSFYDERRIGKKPEKAFRAFSAPPDTRPHEYHRTKPGARGTHFAWGDPLSTASTGMRILGGVLSGILNIGTILGMGFAAVKAGLSILDGHARAENAMARERAKQALDEHQRRMGVPSRVAKDFLGALGYGAAPTRKRLAEMTSTGDIAFYGQLLALADQHKDPLKAFSEGLNLIKKAEFAKLSEEEQKERQKSYDRMTEDFKKTYWASKPRTAGARRELSSREDLLLRAFKGGRNERTGKTIFPFAQGFRASHQAIQAMLGMPRGGAGAGWADHPAMTRTSSRAGLDPGLAGRRFALSGSTDHLALQHAKRGVLVRDSGTLDFVGRLKDMANDPMYMEKERAKAPHGVSRNNWILQYLKGRVMFENIGLDSKGISNLKDRLVEIADLDLAGIHVFDPEQLIVSAAHNPAILKSMIEALQEAEILPRGNTPYDITNDITRGAQTIRLEEAINKMGNNYNLFHVNVEPDGG